MRHVVTAKKFTFKKDLIQKKLTQPSVLLRSKINKSFTILTTNYKDITQASFEMTSGLIVKKKIYIQNNIFVNVVFPASSVTGK